MGKLDEVVKSGIINGDAPLKVKHLLAVSGVFVGIIVFGIWFGIWFVTKENEKSVAPLQTKVEAKAQVEQVKEEHKDWIEKDWKPHIKESADEDIIPANFFRRFQKGTKAEADASSYPSPAEIRIVLHRVNQRAQEELTQYTDAQLDIKLPEPHVVFDTKLGSVFFCSAHELIHAGQIGLLRRLLGKDPLR